MTEEYVFPELIIATRAEAFVVLDRLTQLISRYAAATVADLYDLCGLETKYADNKWGWTELPGVKIVRVDSGYKLDLPKPVSLKE